MASTIEQNAYTSFKNGAVGKLNMWRVENQITSGMADVIGINRNGRAFWLELKAYEAWPIRANTCPLKSKFEKGQLGFLCTWRSWQGNAYVLLRVAKVYYLIPAAMDLESVTKAGLINGAIAVGKTSVIEYLVNLE